VAQAGVEMAGSIADFTRNVLGRDFRHIDPAQAGAAGLTVIVGDPAWHYLSRGSQNRYRFHVLGRRRTSVSAAERLRVNSDKAGRVHVADRLEVPGVARVFVAGDTAALVQNGQSIPGLASAAMQMGVYVGR